jgi:Tfp pilus assembly protein FimT
MVVAILLAIAAFAIPNFLSAVSDYRLKSTMSQVAGLVQQQRMTAVRLNATYRLLNTTSGRTIVWFEPPTTANPSGNGQWDSGEPMVELPGTVKIQNTGFPGDAALAAKINNVQSPSSAVVQFNARGLPCVVVSGACSNKDSSGNQVGFVVYFQGTSTYGKPMWGALTITPAGRVRSWFWDGSAYNAQ